jgi:broad specificity phosphatase PhoE
VNEQQKWPDVIWIVRHGQSSGNVARDAAEAAGRSVVDLPTRDVDVPLSDLGERQSMTLGHWFRKMPAEQRPSAVLASPYVRTRRTAELALKAAELSEDQVTFITDERLREREFGIFDRLTKAGIREKFPDQAEMRAAIGKFYHRPPGGESWCDVILRLRSVIHTLTREYRGERVLIVTYQVVVLCFRYLFERMSEEQILTIDREDDVANCSITSYRFQRDVGPRGKLQLEQYNFVAPLQQEGTAVTTRPDDPVAPK